MKTIPLINSDKVALVDDDDYDRLMLCKWRATQAWGDSWRAMTGHDTFMHHAVIGFPPTGKVTDHKDRNGLNNQKVNLHFVTKSENGFNSKLRSDNTSGRKGVSFHKAMKKWRAYYIENGKETHLGFHSTFEAACAAREKHEMFVWLSKNTKVGSI